ncbi:MAG: class I SAM-dependent RNA methyltransferase [Pseudomonadota bacterium]
MTALSEIIRIAAKGDGVTAGGEHVKGGLPGDVLEADGTLAKGPHHVNPPCQHFGRCGGCQLQHADEEALREFVRSRVANAAEGQGIAIGESLPTHLSPPGARRRATLHGLRKGKRAVIGFREGGSHKIVDLQECLVLVPELTALIAPLRRFIAAYAGKAPVDIALALADQGVDCGMTNITLEGLEATEAALDFARDNGLARLSIDQGYGAETVWEPEPLSVTLAGVPVPMPAGAFLQATGDAEAVMLADAKEWLTGAGVVADLFSGLGTFAFGLAEGRKVLAVEAERAAHLACKTAAARSQLEVHTLHRDLFRNPLDAKEIGRFGAALLDPPRAGAREQVVQIAESSIERVVYVSCNPSSWARDAARLIEAGFKLEKLRPVGQFRWSTHVELVSYFTR